MHSLQINFYWKTFVEHWSGAGRVPQFWLWYTQCLVKVCTGVLPSSRIECLSINNKCLLVILSKPLDPFTLQCDYSLLCLWGLTQDVKYWISFDNLAFVPGITGCGMDRFYMKFIYNTQCVLRRHQFHYQFSAVLPVCSVQMYTLHFSANTTKYLLFLARILCRRVTGKQYTSGKCLSGSLCA